MAELTNAVLAEQIRQLREEFNAHRSETRKEIRELDQEIDLVRGSQNELNVTMSYVKETVKEMNKTLIAMADAQNKQTSKNTLLVSILQVAGGIMIAIIGYWAKGQF
ncbi:hypothetical protein SSIL_1445 [Solibacillus silvestris StLB046]|uniref:Uncharacterized protein n=1 Tax=Solibacillus silvestris (strain StLB046) TaxID=1002809 RepID=F2F2N0_SOLSS|nr:hypothetical protein [Solibacillus silvestris]BAK15868.1 hypothetical protein SSIL_1445 [Solibacillus silvestris StLB046]